MQPPNLTGALRSVACASAITLVSQAAQAATILPLEGRDLDGNTATYEAYYDPNLDVTWLADANYAQTSGFDADGAMTWDTATAWVAGLDIYGISGWRLPSADADGDGTIVNCFGGGIAGCVDNEMGFLFWEEGITTATPAPFSNVQGNTYWSDTEHASDPSIAWVSGFTGSQGYADKNSSNFTYTWVVHSGDVGTSVVPLPAAVWLFGSGLIGLLGMARRQQ